MQRNGKRAREGVLISFTEVVIRMGGDFFSLRAVRDDLRFVGLRQERVNTSFSAIKKYFRPFKSSLENYTTLILFYYYWPTSGMALLKLLIPSFVRSFVVVPFPRRKCTRNSVQFMIFFTSRVRHGSGGQFSPQGRLFRRSFVRSFVRRGPFSS